MTEGSAMHSTYTTISGDTWDLILYKVNGQGAEFQMDQLIAKNPEHRNRVFFPAGVVLKLPRCQKIQNKQEVPPWKR